MGSGNLLFWLRVMKTNWFAGIVIFAFTFPDWTKYPTLLTHSLISFSSMGLESAPRFDSAQISITQHVSNVIILSKRIWLTEDAFFVINSTAFTRTRCLNSIPMHNLQLSSGLPFPDAPWKINNGPTVVYRSRSKWNQKHFFFHRHIAWNRQLYFLPPIQYLDWGILFHLRCVTAKFQDIALLYDRYQRHSQPSIVC